MNLDLIFAIVTRTPLWVWPLLAGLLALGALQARTRQIGLRRATLLSLGLLTWSLVSLPTGFAGPALLLAVAAWAVGAAATALAGRRLVAPRGARWLADVQALHVPGSWLPLLLIVGLFSVKYAAGASFAMHPSWLAEPQVALPVGLLYGAFSGLFMARALALWSLARRASA